MQLSFALHVSIHLRTRLGYFCYAFPLGTRIEPCCSVPSVRVSISSSDLVVRAVAGPERRINWPIQTPRTSRHSVVHVGRSHFGCSLGCLSSFSFLHERTDLTKQVTNDTFAEMCGTSEPRNLYFAATVGGGSGGDACSGISRALGNMGIPVVVCSSYRLNSAVALSLGGVSSSGGGGGGGGSGDGGGEIPVNSRMRDLSRRAISMVELLGRLWPADGPVPAADSVRGKVDELTVALERARSGTLWQVWVQGMLLVW